MGCYVNPETMTKEEWLRQNGFPVPSTTVFEDIPEGMFLVVLVDNGPFRAAAIAYSKAEMNAFFDPRDPRPKKCYLVPLIELKKVSDIEHYLKGD